MRQKIQFWIARLQAHFMRMFGAKTLHISADRAVISFTFDDVPDSALYRGAEILERYGLHGTFYIAGSLVGTQETDRRLIDEDGVRELAERGHEIGCHTYSHKNIATLDQQQLQLDIAENRSFLQRVLGLKGRLPEKLNFAYPYNAVSYPLYKRLARSYRSCRAGENRINRGAVCPQMLYGMEIDQSEGNQERLKREIDAVKAQPGWLIFFTHDISDNPSPYGCTPHNFEQLVQYARDSGCEILTVDQALQHYMTEAPA